MQSNSLYCLCEKTVSVLFEQRGPKRTKKAEKVSPLRRRRGLRALDLRRLLEKAGENLQEFGASKLFTRPLRVSNP